MRRLRGVALCALLAAPAAMAADRDFEFGRYLAKYPGMYATATLSQDPRDRVFDAGGEEQDSALPAYGDGVEFEQSLLQAQLEWFFPWFESEQIPFVSSRLWTARARLGHARLDTQGAVLDEDAEPGLSAYADGITDIELAFGPVLYGSADWRNRHSVPLSVLLLLEALLPVGERDDGSPNNAGGNVRAFGAQLGLHARPADGWLIDAGARWRSFAGNEEPAFGGHEPAQRGDQWVLDATLARRLWRSLYASASGYHGRGDDNEYRNPRFAADEPAADPLMETFPAPGTYTDQGTELTELGLALHWFATPRLRLGAHYLLPLDGASGSFELPYLQQLQDCAGTVGCDPQPNGSAAVDGQGAARAYASERWMLSLAYSFGQGDFWFTPR